MTAANHAPTEHRSFAAFWTSVTSRRRGAEPSWRPGLYQPNHDTLLVNAQPVTEVAAGKCAVAGTRVDAVAVPASRDPANLMEAAKVARVAGKMLIVLCSRKCRQDEARLQLATFDPQVPVLLVDMDGFSVQSRSRALKRFGWPGWTTDTAVKRNSALLLARRLELRHVLFLDDDVRKVDIRQVRQSISALEIGSHRAAAWKFLDYPDNSAISHAYRRLRNAPYGKQNCFVTGGGLLVRIDDHVPHFPVGIYNEDWFFLFPLLLDRQVKHLGSLKQLKFDPFEIPRNAVLQEFGDIIAESLFTLLGRRAGETRENIHKEITTAAFWRRELRNRRAFLQALSRELRAENDDRRTPSKLARLTNRHPNAVVQAVNGAAAASRKIKARHVRAWVRSWLADQEDWNRLWSRQKADQGGAPALTKDRIEACLRRDLTDIGLENRVHPIWPESRSASEVTQSAAASMTSRTPMDPSPTARLRIKPRLIPGARIARSAAADNERARWSR